MRAWRVFGIVTILVLAGASTLPAQEDPPRLSPEDARQLAECIETIRAADKPEDAVSAYATACAIDRGSLELHEAQMRKMLKLGLPQGAYYPAVSLTQRDQRQGLAWGVVGWRYAKDGRWPEALNATLRAALNEKDNAGVLYNLGVLVAWYESDPVAKSRVASDVASGAGDAKRKYGGNEAFSRGYDQAGQSFRNQQQVRHQWASKISAAESELGPLRRKVDDIHRQVRDLANDLQGKRNERGRYQNELNDLEKQAKEKKDKNLTNRINDVKKQIDRLDKEISDIDKKGSALNREGQSLFQDFGRKKTAIEQMRRESEQEIRKAAPDPTFQPPAVDGVIVPEQEMPVMTGTTSPPVGGESPSGEGPSQAESRLRLAKLYIANRMKDKARDVLEEIVLMHEGTDAAKEAASLLAELGQP